MDEALKAVSNVIELKPDKKYLLVFKGNITHSALDGLLSMLRREGIRGIGLMLSDGQELEVIEAPTMEEYSNE